ncbi:heparinase II/III domain-containing protein [Dryocola clanedunensis]|uniref:heparinase II/III domain-containing protein n=1 Tax=Cedecea sulfonylureivorans TaxID=3051154 RepID=UPI001928D821|nr:heparinase II/III family protein [Cedecea sulfonylureivorans]
MKLFTQAQITRARARVTPKIINALIERNSDVLNHDILVPSTGCATWNHYFFCPEHSVRLQWERRSPNKHRCPIDGAVFTGEPYYGAWWRWLNGLNARACYEVAVLWLLTDDSGYLNKVIALLMQYAKYYPDYQVHGDIPYNGPGKANAQTLCEANCHADFARGFDIICSVLNDEQYNYIADRLLRCGAEFMMQHRCRQIHNHEVIINATIGMIGTILDDEKYLDFAVRGEYGLLYQLEHALLPGGMWFEGSLHYHLYALQGFIAFEKLAQKGAYSLMGHKYYRQMLALPLKLLMPDMTMPKVNDCVNGQETIVHTDIYEFAYGYYQDPQYAQVLNHIYMSMPRTSIDALFYGEDLPEGTLPPPAKTLHDPGSGFTLIRNHPGRAVCIKHGPYGGEHDHYDRLNLIVFNNYRAVIPDLGTTGYGAPLHYGYYKNTFAHNTLCVNGLNQPPAAPRVLFWEDKETVCTLVTEVAWVTPPALPNSKVRVEWDKNSYDGIIFRRYIKVTENLLIDILETHNPHYQCVDGVYHIASENKSVVQNSHDFKICYPYVTQAKEQPLMGKKRLVYHIDEPLSITCFSTNTCTLIQAKGPNNPSTSLIDYLVLRSRERHVLQVFVTDFTGQGNIDIVREGHNVIVTDMTSGKVHTLGLYLLTDRIQ